ncbi:winged helix-turn-helix transcriptional regulator [Peribacillus sp. TH16]|uniref:ArsR/SmtB family transcription factor n=1 Tax=unclassified Peribacillus TaxID=2675266 RepID=UPI001911B233|nr:MULTISPECIES: metalloregulator ArsR/SmtB family transcription factor [unclassified Peribacillus]MBK5445235.1 winged helix-turn-helix transcriptional regulator [Peribacillus sp. TH24]MBK5460040.1 winged helix-turn-helix transcriptional regulator [Peribacillus sp. TH27]MBK5481854.1 winged helix-turn-helix transcriptional regulator [Peribacillus sp. TH16]WMX56652.1 metalloregulator ArsR/SmtB family transcription factor [Peribacillus sp. R9-11]
MQTNEAADIEIAASILKLLGDKTRLTMVKIMSEHECCVCEFVDLFDMSQPAISQHLRKLKDSGIVNEARRGQWIFYSLNQTSSYYSFIQTVIKDLPSQAFKVEELTAQGKRICCD